MKDIFDKKNHDGILNYLIYTMGTHEVLELFASYLGRDCLLNHTCEIKQAERRTYKPPVGWEGLVYNGAHWKGYDKNGKLYDSYEQNIQLPKTNNFCQSYACFLWSSHGLVNEKRGYKLIPGQYVENIITMCNILHDFISSNKQKMIPHMPLISEFDEVFGYIKINENIHPTQENLVDILLEILDTIRSNKSIASELSKSHE